MANAARAARVTVPAAKATVALVVMATVPAVKATVVPVVLKKTKPKP